MSLVRERLMSGNKERSRERSSVSVSGIGLKNVHERLAILYGQDFLMEIESTQYKGTKVILNIPREKGKLGWL